MEIIDGTAKFKIKDKRQHHCLGEIVALISTPPIYEHLLECNGQTISETDYPELVNILGTNIVPNLNGRVLQGSNTPNTFISAGLPNITGDIPCYWASVNPIWNNTNAFYTSSKSNNQNYHGTSTNSDSISFSAARSNPIYGNSTTVQPPAYTVKYYICYQS